MTRDVEGLVRQRYDLLVVGGGIHGLFAAYDAALRGCSVALVDRADFGGGVSFNHQRTIHGGLRAMQHGQLLKTRRQIRERRTWARIAPHLLRPLPFLIGTYRGVKRSRSALRLGLKVYDLLGRRRNDRLSPELHLPKSRLESRAATRRLFPGIAESGLTGGAIWYDYQTRHPDRLTWTVALAAEQAGARLCNYVEAVGLERRNGKAAAVTVRDRTNGTEYSIEATATLLAPGSGLSTTQRALGLTGAPPMLRAMNLLLNRPARDIALAAPAGSGRMMTAVPWAGYVLVGTYQSEEPVDDVEHSPPRTAIDTFLSEVSSAFPKLAPSQQDIRLVHHGLVPAGMQRGRYDLLPEPEIHRHSSSGRSGIVSLVGVKYSSARLAAQRAIDAIFAESGRSRGRCLTADRVLPHAGIADVEGRLVETSRQLGVELDDDVASHLAGWYGTEASDVLRLAAERNLLDRLAPGTAVIAGEIAYAAVRAAAVRLSDAVLRRTPLGSPGRPESQALQRAAGVMGQTLGWTTEQIATEIRDVEDFYP